MPTVDRLLNIVIPLSEDGSALKAHSVPISRAVFERYWAVIMRTFNFAVGTAGPGAPRIASLALRDVAEEMGFWEDRAGINGNPGKPGVKNGLLAEIRRLTNVVAFDGSAGWVALPLDTAVQQGKMDDEQEREVESAAVFFTLASWALNRESREELYKSGAGISGALVTSSSLTALISSSKTSIAAETIGAKATESSIPS
jgi:hypothetical protein